VSVCVCVLLNSVFVFLNMYMTCRYLESNECVEVFFYSFTLVCVCARVSIRVCESNFQYVTLPLPQAVPPPNHLSS
jgi:hypothetical protein